MCGSKAIRGWHGVALAVGGVVAAIIGGEAALAQEASPEPLFPKPFLVEHRLIEMDADGSTFESPSVVDTYAGAWIISVRADGSRTIVDFARREITTVEPEKGSYSVLGFDRMAELRRRLAVAENLERTPADAGSSRDRAGVSSNFRTTMRDVAVTEGLDSPVLSRAPLLRRPGVRRLHVTATPESSHDSTKAEPVEAAEVDVWLDPSVTLGEGARAALRRFEIDVLAGGKIQGFSQCVAAARDEARGAFPIRTERRSTTRAGAARIVDETVRLESLVSVPAELLRVPDGMRRVPHPLEAVVAFAEEEVKLNRAMSGAGK